MIYLNYHFLIYHRARYSFMGEFTLYYNIISGSDSLLKLGDSLNLRIGLNYKRHVQLDKSSIITKTCAGI